MQEKTAGSTAFLYRWVDSQMTHIVSMTVGLWTHVGPGVFFAASLPVLLVLFGFVARTGYRRIRAR